MRGKGRSMGRSGLVCWRRRQPESGNCKQVGGAEKNATKARAKTRGDRGRILRQAAIKGAGERAERVMHDGAARFLLCVRKMLSGRRICDGVGGLHGGILLGLILLGLFLA